MDKPLSPPAGFIFGFVAVNALVAAVILLFFPARTAALFFWEITPPINAALFGALYLSGAAVVGRLTWRGLWEPARFITPVLVSAGVLISITTLLHLDRFAPGIRLVYWLIIYIGAPLLALGIYWQHERGGANWVVNRPLRPLTGCSRDHGGAAGRGRGVLNRSGRASGSLSSTWLCSAWWARQCLPGPGLRRAASACHACRSCDR